MMKARQIMLFIDPPSHHFERDRLFELQTVEHIGDNLLAPYVHLRNWFNERGVRVHTADRLVREEMCGDLNVYVSLGILENYRKLARRAGVILSACFALECPVVEPRLYRGLVDAQAYFRRLFSYSDSQSLQPFTGRPLDCRPFSLPQAFDGVHEQIWSRTQRDFLVMINGNRLPRVYLNELYTERLRAVEFFSRTGEIDLYGHGWDGPPYRVGRTWVPATARRIQREIAKRWQRVRPDPLLSAARRVYRGPTSSKIATLGRYRFALCFENSILNGWITEKIFDCFYAGTVPVYWGAPEIADRVPSDCFIDMRRFPDYGELRRFLKSLGERDIAAYKESARRFLKSEKFRPFSTQAFVDLFRHIVEEDTGASLIQPAVTECAL